MNEEWISDKTRHVVDGLRRQRLDRPYVRENGKLRAGHLGRGLRRDRREGRRASTASASARSPATSRGVEEMFALKDLLGEVRLDQPRLSQGGDAFDPKLGRALATCSTPTIAGIEQADALLIVGANPRKEAAGAQRPHPQALAHRRAARSA